MLFFLLLKLIVVGIYKTTLLILMSVIIYKQLLEE